MSSMFDVSPPPGETGYVIDGTGQIYNSSDIIGPMPGENGIPLPSDYDTFVQLREQAKYEIRTDIDLLNAIGEYSPPTKEFDINTIGQRIPLELLPTEDSPYARSRYPRIIPTEDYLNVEAGTVDRIEFPVPRQFYRVAIPEIQWDSGLNPAVEDSQEELYSRDIAQFLIITTNRSTDITQWYSILTTSPIWDRFKVESLLDFDFSELTNA